MILSTEGAYRGIGCVVSLNNPDHLMPMRHSQVKMRDHVKEGKFVLEQLIVCLVWIQ